MLGIFRGEVPHWEGGISKEKQGGHAVIKIIGQIAYKVLSSARANNIEREYEMSQMLWDRAREMYPYCPPVVPVLGYSTMNTPDEVKKVITMRTFHQSVSEFCNEKEVNSYDFYTIAMGMLRLVHVGHSCDVVFRDLKLANFLLDNPSGFIDQVVGCDFGMVRKIDKLDETASVAYGNVQTLPPECLGGTYSETNPKQRDLYALGIMFYQLLTGEYPYEISGVHDRDSSFKVHRLAHLNRAPRENSKLGVYRDLVFKLLEKYPPMRYQTIEELMEDFNNIVNE